MGACELTRPCHGLGHETLIPLHDHSCIGPGMSKPNAPTGWNSNELVLILWLLAHQSPAKPIPVEPNQFFNKAWRLVAAFDLEIYIAY